MLPLRRCAAAGLALVILACSATPLVMPPGTSTPTAADLAPASDAAAVPSGASSILPIPMHVGYGASGSWFEVFFSDPSSPASAQASGGLDGPLVEAIDEARLSVHLAMFSLTLNGVREALLRAHRRGVSVRMVTESDNLDSDDLQRLIEAGIPVLGDRRDGTMHNKFMIIDGHDVWTGSMNYTVSGAYADNNVLLHVESTGLASNYETEFAEMFEDDSFGPEEGRRTPHPQVVVEGTLIESYFAPDDGVEPALAHLLDTAQDSVYFLAYSFTSNELGGAIRRAYEAGLAVRGVLDEDQGLSNLGTELTSFLGAGLDVRTDGNPGQMHEKVLIVDGEVVVLGSYNFSRNANETNDENVLVIHSADLAAQFVLEMERLYSIASP